MENTDEKEDPPDAGPFKERGNECVKNGNFKEAALLYTKAIKIEPKNELLYSNRSLAYLKLQQYYLAFGDAEECIQLNSSWAKGYFRKGEVESAAGLLDDAYESYDAAHRLLPNDPNIMEAMVRVSLARKKKAEAKERYPWLFACIGLIIGVIYTILDYTVTREPKLTNPILQVGFTLTMAGIFWLGTYAFMSILEQQSIKSLHPNGEEVTEENIPEENHAPEKTSNKYTKAQARYRYKKGKQL